MKIFILLLNMLLCISCFSQKKISLIQMNGNLLNNNDVPFDTSVLDSMENVGMKAALTKFRILGAKSCNINSEKKYSHIYIEDGFHHEEGFYNGIIIIDNDKVCEVTTSPYKLRLDSLSYNKVIENNAGYNNMGFYTKKISMKDFKKKYVDEYFRYQLVIQDKVDDLKKCLAVDEYTPKSIVDAKNYYFNKDIKIYGTITLEYSDIKNGIDGMPYLNEEKEKEFIECINNLNILKISNKEI